MAQNGTNLLLLVLAVIGGIAILAWIGMALMHGSMMGGGMMGGGVMGGMSAGVWLLGFLAVAGIVAIIVLFTRRRA